MKRRISLLLAVIMTAATVAAASVDINAAETGNDASAGQTVVEETKEEEEAEPVPAAEEAEPNEPQAADETGEKVEEAEAADTGIEETVTEPEENAKKLPLTWKRFRKVAFHLWRQFDDPYYAGFAAQIAYFLFMASVPMLIVLTQVLGLFDISIDFCLILRYDVL